jgi:hypothetical protein
VYTVIQEMRGASGERLILHGPNIINLCIDDYGREKQCGRLYHQYTDQKMSFSTLFEALEKMEQLYDELQFPQATTRIRSFIPEQNAGGGKRRTAAEPGRACGAEEAEAAGRERGAEEAEAAGKECEAEEVAGRESARGAVGPDRKCVQNFDSVISRRGGIATFLIYVQFRQFSSWQGQLTWMEGRKRRIFLSVVELLRLMDDAIAASGEETGSEKRFHAGRAGNQEGKGARAESGFHGK